MSRNRFDFLSESFLFDDQAIAEQYEGVGAGELGVEVRRYAQHVASVEPARPGGSTPPGLRTTFDTTSGQAVDVATLKRSALYFDTVVVEDPLAGMLTDPDSNADGRVYADFLELGGPREDRERIARAAAFMKGLTPMVAAGFVEFASDPPAASGPGVPVFYSECAYADRIPEWLEPWLREQTRVHELRRHEEGFWYSEPDVLVSKPCRAIVVKFPEHRTVHSSWLPETEVLGVDESESAFQIRQTFPDEPPNAELFWAWVAQRRNSAAASVISTVAANLRRADQYQALLATNSPFTARVLSATERYAAGVEAQIAELALQLRLPVLDGLSVAALMRVRDTEGAAFETFRVALARGLRELRHEDDETRLRARLDDVRHELAEIGLREVDLAVSRVKREFAVEAVGAVISAILPAQLSLMGLVTAGASAAQTLMKDRSQVRAHPAYFLWKLDRASTSGSNRGAG